jgi:hypothetical protein
MTDAHSLCWWQTTETESLSEAENTPFSDVGLS